MREGTRERMTEVQDECTSTHINGGSDHRAPVVRLMHDGEEVLGDALLGVEHLADPSATHAQRQKGFSRW